MDGITTQDTAIYRKEPAWHQKGIVFQDDLALRDVVERAGLGWTVKTQPVYTLDGLTSRYTPIPGKKAIVREDTGAPLGVVGDRWEPVQNTEMAEFGQALIDSGDAKVESAFSLFGGKRVVIEIRLGEDILIGGKDPVSPFLMLSNGHDGTRAFTVLNTAVRVVCANTEAIAVAGAQQRFSVTHTRSIHGRIEEARQTLGMSFKYFDGFAKMMNTLTEVPFNDDQMNSLSHALIRPEKDVNKMTEQERENLAKARASLFRVYTGSPTVDRGTGYGAFNAVTEWFDHFKGTERRSSDLDKAQDRRIESILFGSGTTLKDRAVDLILAGR